MRRAAVTLALLATIAGLAACTDDPPKITVPSRPAAAPEPTRSAGPAPSTMPTDVCTQARQTTRVLGPAVVIQFRAEGLAPKQVLERLRAVYQLAENSLSGLRAQASDARLRAALAAVEAQYRDIRGRLRRPEDIDRVNLQPGALKTALASLDRACA